jgi:hypothetical protein
MLARNPEETIGQRGTYAKVVLAAEILASSHCLLVLFIKKT